MILEGWKNWGSQNAENIASAPKIIACFTRTAPEEFSTVDEGGGWRRQRNVVNVEWMDRANSDRGYAVSEVTNKKIFSLGFHECVGAVIYGRGKGGKNYAFMLHVANKGINEQALDRDIEKALLNMVRKKGVNPTNIQIGMWGGYVPPSREERAREDHHRYHPSAQWRDVRPAEQAAWTALRPELLITSDHPAYYPNFLKRLGGLLEGKVHKFGGNADAWVYGVRMYGAGGDSYFDPALGRLWIHNWAEHESSANTPFLARDIDQRMDALMQTKYLGN